MNTSDSGTGKRGFGLVTPRFYTEKEGLFWWYMVHIRGYPTMFPELFDEKIYLWQDPVSWTIDE